MKTAFLLLSLPDVESLEGVVNKAFFLCDSVVVFLNTFNIQLKTKGLLEMEDL